MHRSHRVAGAIVGSAVGDALGAPFASGPPGQFSARFPSPARGVHTELCGGGDREPGEFTDNTQLALLLASSLVGHGGLDEGDVVKQEHVAGNRSLVRTTPAAVWFSRFGSEATVTAARRISALTDGDPSAGEGCAIFHELMRVALDGGDPLAAIPPVLALVAPEHRDRWAVVLAPEWTPEQATESNGAVWATLGRAVWALRHARSFDEAMRLAVDLGGDTDTVAAVAGGLAGAVYGIACIPMRWTSVVHGRVPGFADRVWRLAGLEELAPVLDGRVPVPHANGVIPTIGPTEVLPGIWAANLDGARFSEPDFAVISLCRVAEPFGHPVHRMAYLADNDHNTEIDVVLDDILEDMAALRAEGRKILVHCHGGASRTGLVLRAWLRRTEGVSPQEATDTVAAKRPYLGLWNASFTAALGRMSSPGRLSVPNDGDAARGRPSEGSPASANGGVTI